MPTSIITQKKIIKKFNIEINKIYIMKETKTRSSWQRYCLLV